MAAAVKLRTDYSAFDLRRLAAGTRHANQSRRLLSLAAVLDGMDREQGDCQDFRVRAAIMDPMEVPDGTTQSPAHS